MMLTCGRDSLCDLFLGGPGSLRNFQRSRATEGRCILRGRQARLYLAQSQGNASISKSEIRQFQKNLVIPNRLVCTGRDGRQNGEQTVYTVRLSTGYSRGSGLDEWNAGVQLCLIGENGSALLHYVPPVFDPDKLQQELEAISEVMDTSLGANRIAISSATDRIESVPAGKQRFQSGSIDEVSFLGPEIGNVQSLLVAPESGSWRLEEATVSSSRSRSTNRFVCGRLLGEKGGAGFLAAVSPEGVVYGSGESLVVLTRNQARALHEAGMGKYSQFKKRVLEANLSLVGIGTGLAWTFAGDSTALDFAYGGAGGLIYMSLLQHGADALPLSNSKLDSNAQKYVPGQVMSKILASGFFRVALVGLGVACAIYGSRSKDPSMHSTPNQMQQLLAGTAGFLMYKLAIIGVLSLPPLVPSFNPPQSEN